MKYNECHVTEGHEVCIVLPESFLSLNKEQGSKHCAQAPRIRHSVYLTIVNKLCPIPFTQRSDT